VTGITPGSIGDYTYIFYKDSYPGGIVQNSASNTLTGQGIGTYYVEAVHTATNCTSEVFEYEIIDESIPPVLFQEGITFQSNCFTSNPNGTMTVSGDGSTDVSAYDFAWYLGSTASGTVLGTTATLTGMSSGDYTLMVTSLTNGCATTETFQMIDEIQDPIELVLTSSSNTVCGDLDGDGMPDYNGRVAISVQNPQIAVSDYTYFMVAGMLVNFDTTGLTPVTSITENLENGDYTVFVFDPTGGCVSDFVNVTVGDDRNLNDLDFRIDEDLPLTNCDPLRPNAEATIVPLSDDPSRYTFYWHDGPSITDPVLDSTLTLTAMEAKTYFVEMIDRYTACAIDQSITIQDATQSVPFPDVTKINDRTNCTVPNGAATASIDGEILNFTFVWQTTAGDTITVSNSVGGLDVGNYNVSAMNLTTGCTSDAAALVILENVSDPVFNVATKESICSNNNGEADILFAGNTPEIDSIAWALDGVVVSDDFRLGSAQAGNYSVYVRDGNNCSWQEDFIIETDVIIYNGVSDNGDGRNDIFLIDCAQFFPGNNVQIFNRSGAIVYEASGYDNTGTFFGGESNTGIAAGGDGLPPGTYFYIFDKGNGDQVVQGYLELVR